MAAPYYGWYVVAACATIACFFWGFAFYGLGVFGSARHRRRALGPGAARGPRLTCGVIAAHRAPPS